MRAFEYRAATPSGEVVVGTAWASSEAELDVQLGTKDLVLTTARELSARHRARTGSLTHDERILLTGQLATVTAAGVPLVEGLRGIGERMPRPPAKALVRSMVTALEAGESLSGVLEAYPRAFPPVLRASVRAGEEAGALDRVLGRVSRHLEWVRAMRATTVQALIYPAILCAAIAGLILILLYFVLPRIVGMFPGGVEDLPAQTRFVLGVSTFLRERWALVLVGTLATAAGGALVLRRPRGRLALDRLILAIPKLGPVAAQIATSKFACTASILQASGCDVFVMLEVAASTCGNEALAAALQRATQRVRRGVSLSEALEAEPMVDPLLVQMVSVGERTGRLDLCLERLVEHYDDEVPRAVKRYLTLLEPMLLLGAGAIVAFILLAALLPIFDLYDSIG